MVHIAAWGIGSGGGVVIKFGTAVLSNRVSGT